MVFTLAFSSKFLEFGFGPFLHSFHRFPSLTNVCFFCFCCCCCQHFCNKNYKQSLLQKFKVCHGTFMLVTLANMVDATTAAPQGGYLASAQDSSWCSTGDSTGTTMGPSTLSPWGWAITTGWASTTTHRDTMYAASCFTAKYISTPPLSPNIYQMPQEMPGHQFICRF